MAEAEPRTKSYQGRAGAEFRNVAPTVEALQRHTLQAVADAFGEADRMVREDVARGLAPNPLTLDCVRVTVQVDLDVAS